MFGWFRPKCPVDHDVKRWIAGRTHWLIDQFGWNRVRDRAMVLPTDDYFPQPYRGTREDVHGLLDRVCHYMQVNRERVQLDFYSETSGLGQNSYFTQVQPGSLGLYDEHPDRTSVWLEVSHLSDPGCVVATLAHELGHIHLLGDRRVTPETPDHEPLTDLLTVVLGLGIFTANSVLRDVSYHVGHWESWTVARQGYLTAPMFGYALAMLARWRGEQWPGWAQFLRPDVRSPFRQALRYLAETDDATPSRGRYSAVSGAVDFPADAFAYPRYAVVSQSSGAGLGGDPGATEGVMGIADERFTRGVLLARQGDFERAVAEFSEAILLAPADGECYQQRSLAYTQLGRYAQAVADAEQAVRLDPEDCDGYLARGTAQLGAGQYQRAIGDLDHFIREDQASLGAHYRLAEAYFWRGLARAAQGDATGAVGDLTQASRQRPHWADVYLARARVYEQMGRKDKACRDRDEADRLQRGCLEL